MIDPREGDESASLPPVESTNSYSSYFLRQNWCWYRKLVCLPALVPGSVLVQRFPKQHIDPPQSIQIAHFLKHCASMQRAP